MIKKAILTGGGRATRLRPITTTINKHLIPLAGEPMIFHAIKKVIDVGVEKIYINVNPGETELQKAVGDGRRWGIKIEFFEQVGGPQGIAHVVKQAQNLIGSDPFIFYLSDNIILGKLDELVNDYNQQNLDCMLALAKVPDPERFGIPYFDETGKLIDAREKPANPPNNFAITGIYIFGPNLFFKAFDNIKPSARGEYEIPDIYSYLIKNNYQVGYKEITGWWKDTGKPDDLLLANALLMDQKPADFWTRDKIKLGAGVKIGANVELIGPAIIGRDCRLDDCHIGPHTYLGDNCHLKSVKVENSLIFDNCQIECNRQIRNSIIGRNAVIREQAKDDSANNLIVGDNSLINL